MATYMYPSHSKVVTLPSGTKYAWTYIPPANSSKPTLLFLHGFPSSSYDWRRQLSHFSSPSSPLHGSGLLAPDLLGYALSAHPPSPTAYSARAMAAHIAEILDYESIPAVHAIAHDWGCALLSRLLNYHSERVLSAAFLAVAYMPPGGRMDLDAVNGMTKKLLGYEMFGYWRFLERPDAGDIVKKHVSSVVDCGFLLLLFSMFSPVSPLSCCCLFDTLKSPFSWVP